MQKNNWKTFQIEELCLDIGSGGTPSTKNAEFWKGTIPWISGTDIVNQKVTSSRKCITKEAVTKSSARLCPKNSIILVSRVGVGKIAIVPFELAISQDITNLIIRKEIVLAEFMFFALQISINRLLRYNQGTSINGITQDTLRNLELDLPPLPEQKKIANILLTWDKAIETTEKIIFTKRKRKKALMQILLTGKQRFPEFQSRKWREYKISELFEEVTRFIEWNDEALYKLVSIRRRFGGLFPRGDFWGKQIAVKKLKSVHAGDFLISKRQVSHGAWGVVKPEFHDTKVSNEYDCLTVKDVSKINVDFWGWFCKTPLMQHYSYLASNGVHIEKLIFDFNAFKKRAVVIPQSIEEQKRIAEVLSACDSEIYLLERQRDALKQQKRGLMQKLLTGKIRVIIDESEKATNG